MNTDLKVRWVAALRSGEYEQGKNVLKTEDGRFCCLGVLCDLIDKSKWGKKTKDAGVDITGRRIKCIPYDGCLQMIPKRIEEEIGFYNTMRFAGLNDKGMSFDGIAYVVETEGVQGTER